VLHENDFMMNLCRLQQFNLLRTSQKVRKLWYGSKQTCRSSTYFHDCHRPVEAALMRADRRT